MNKPIGDIKNYKVISIVLFISFFICGAIILVLNLNSVNTWVECLFGDLKSEIIKQYFYGALGATISSSFFLSQDVEINETESLKTNPNYEILRYPTKQDVFLYIQRIISSGFFAVIGVFVIIAGFTYLEIKTQEIGLKHKILFGLISFLIGLFQGKFYNHLKSIFERVFKQGN